MVTEQESMAGASEAERPPSAPSAAEAPRITPAPTSSGGDRGPQMIERTRRRGRRRRAPVFTPQEVRQIDYKDVDKLKKLISDRGRIEPRRKTGLTAKDQRKLSREIKRARFVALLPYTAEHMRQTSRYRMVSRMVQRAERAAQETALQETAPPVESEETPESEAAVESASVSEVSSADAVPAASDAPVEDAEAVVEAVEDASAAGWLEIAAVGSRRRRRRRRQVKRRRTAAGRASDV